jgi:hypothetical protein
MTDEAFSLVLYESGTGNGKTDGNGKTNTETGTRMRTGTGTETGNLFDPSNAG